MVHGAEPPIADPAPHADTGLARDCDECRGWGTVVTDQGHHELCPACQPVAPWPGHREALTRVATHVRANARQESPAGGQ